MRKAAITLSSTILFPNNNLTNPSLIKHLDALYSKLAAESCIQNLQDFETSSTIQLLDNDMKIWYEAMISEAQYNNENIPFLESLDGNVKFKISCSLNKGKILEALHFIRNRPENLKVRFSIETPQLLLLDSIGNKLLLCLLENYVEGERDYSNTFFIELKDCISISSYHEF